MSASISTRAFILAFVALLFVQAIARDTQAGSETVWTSWSADAGDRKEIIARLSEYLGIDGDLQEAHITQILNHAVVEKIGDWYILFNPAHELFIFISESAERNPRRIGVLTIAVAAKLTNEDQKISRDRLVRSFVEGPQLIEGWRSLYLRDSSFFERLFVSSNSLISDKVLQQEAQLTVLGPFQRILNRSLSQCFSFIERDKWASYPELAKLRELDPAVAESLTIADFYEEVGDQRAVLLGETVTGIVYVLVGAKTDSRACLPTRVDLLTSR